VSAKSGALNHYNLDIFQSYVPEAATLDFSVPSMPEGMMGANRFDSDRGRLSTVGSLSGRDPALLSPCTP
jgi:hypothetical protein